MNLDALITKTITGKAPCIVGLDVSADELPAEFCSENEVAAVRAYNRAVIDAICELVPAISVNFSVLIRYGLGTVADAVSYAKEKGLFTVIDAKCSGEPVASGSEAKLFFEELDADCVTVSPFYGASGLAPFFEYCSEYDKVTFVVAHSDRGTTQDLQELMAGLRPVYRAICEKVALWGDKKTGDMGFSNIGIMLGGLPNNTLREFRRIYKKNMFLLTGYDGKKTSAHDINGAFDMRGLGGLVYVTRIITLPEGDAEFSVRVKSALEEVCRDLRLCF